MGGGFWSRDNGWWVSASLDWPDAPGSDYFSKFFRIHRKSGASSNAEANRILRQRVGWRAFRTAGACCSSALQTSFSRFARYRWAPAMIEISPFNAGVSSPFHTS